MARASHSTRGHAAVAGAYRENVPSRWTTLREGRAVGRARRGVVSRASLAASGPRDRDPVALLVDQNADRLTDLVALRMFRLVQSPFSFLRGSAALMAHDLAVAPTTDIDLVACGDAHLANFGLFASPERRLLFDINDFDETSTAPWEWDLKRLAASAMVGSRDNGWSDEQARDAAASAARGYRSTLLELLEHTALERFYAHVGADDLIERSADTDDRSVVDRTIARARRHDADHLLRKVTVTSSDGRLRFVDDPPILQRIEVSDVFERLFTQYRRTVRYDVDLVLEQFTLVDAARRVVGVGSVGTRCYLVLLQGPSAEPLFLQLKEAAASVLVTHGARAPMDVAAQGERVVRGQRILQSASDPFLGWVSIREHDYYCRQFRDLKGSVELGLLGPSQFQHYSELCGRALARSHAQHRASAVVAGYVGRSDRLETVIAAWAGSYAEQVERDHAALVAASRSGRVAVDG